MHSQPQPRQWAFRALLIAENRWSVRNPPTSIDITTNRIGSTIRELFLKLSNLPKRHFQSSVRICHKQQNNNDFGWRNRHEKVRARKTRFCQPAQNFPIMEMTLAHHPDRSSALF
jgi:hypothetical protein